MKIEKEEIDETVVKLDAYNSDLNLIIDASCYSATPMHNEGFAFMWAGARATHGVTTGKYCFEVKIGAHLNVSHLPVDEPNPHVVRVGFSAESSSLQLGEDHLSFGYGGTGKKSNNCKFFDYDTTFSCGDVILGVADMDSALVTLGFAKNGKFLGWAFKFNKSELKGGGLFPHVLTKNVAFEVNFGHKEQPFCSLPDDLQGFYFIGCLPFQQRVSGIRAPKRKEDCEMLMMCGLPGAGKSVWALTYSKQHPERKYNILGTNNIIDKMKVMGLPRKRNYAGRWEVLIKLATNCLNKLFEIASKLRRNYILDQTNVYPNAQRRKMTNFKGYKRIAVVVVPTDAEYKRRCKKRDEEEGKDVPDDVVREMKANFKIPEVGDIFDEVLFPELPKEAAKRLVAEYNEDARASLGPAPKHFKRNDSPSKFGGNRGFDSGRGGRGFDSAHGGFDNGRGYQGNYGGNRGFDGNRGDRNRGGFDGNRGGFDGRRSDGNRGSFDGRGDGNRGGFDGRGDGNRGGYNSGHGGFKSGPGGYNNGRGAFESNRSGYSSGYDNNKSNFTGNLGGYNSGREGYSGGRGGYGSKRGIDDSTKWFDRSQSSGNYQGGYGGGPQSNFERYGDNSRGFASRGNGRGNSDFGGRDKNYGDSNSGSYSGSSLGQEPALGAYDKSIAGSDRGQPGYREPPPRGGNFSSGGNNFRGNYGSNDFNRDSGSGYGGYREYDKPSSGYRGASDAFPKLGPQGAFKMEPGTDTGTFDSGDRVARGTRPGGRVSRWGAEIPQASSFGEQTSAARDQSFYSSYGTPIKTEPLSSTVATNKDSSASSYSSYAPQSFQGSSQAYGYQSSGATPSQSWTGSQGTTGSAQAGHFIPNRQQWPQQPQADQYSQYYGQQGSGTTPSYGSYGAK
ncbi:heterogeneous nuclear ribonucleoprotein U-like protein 1 [Trichonephila inaurata madagascariensis]|uniref:Heterogeneous nuclear ribonucleoprotein U-like protein 1 n=1 Tax=Trichonephila inaurata madagascariensis TaxID=2747483 RepID=A0A8X6MBU4_9ARAC|nr:heterogeneous nuclear ribonucleoprotein U-like protein 1 [Trichonephila inaurata madagascariensis]